MIDDMYIRLEWVEAQWAQFMYLHSQQLSRLWPYACLPMYATVLLCTSSQRGPYAAAQATDMMMWVLHSTNGWVTQAAVGTHCRPALTDRTSASLMFYTDHCSCTIYWGDYAQPGKTVSPQANRGCLFISAACRAVPGCSHPARPSNSGHVFKPDGGTPHLFWRMACLLRPSPGCLH